jgi:hypothetical protein
MPAFFSLDITPNVTRTYASIEHTTISLDITPNVTRAFDCQTTANANVNAFGSKTTGYDLTTFNNVSLSCNAVATKRLVQFLPALTDLISDNGAIRTTSSNINSTANIAFLGGRLIDNIVNARYNNVGYVLEGYVVNEPAAKAFAELRVESDITIVLAVNVVSTLSVDPTFTFRPSINLSSVSTLSCSVTGVALIELQTFGNATLAVDYNRIREHSSNIVASTVVYANADFRTDGVQLVASAATMTITVAKILGNIVIGNLPVAFTLGCIGDDLILDEAQIYAEVRATLTARAGRRHFVQANLVANAGTVFAGTVEHIDEYVYVIPAEDWTYTIGSESRYYKIRQESGIRKIANETRLYTINGESRIHTTRRD